MAYPSSKMSASPAHSSSPLTPVRVERKAPVRLFPPWHHALLHLLTVLVFAASTILVWIFGYTFWTLLEAATRAFQWGHGHSVVAPLIASLTRQNGILGIADGWPLDIAIVTALLATWCSLYLAFDHLILWGNRSAQRLLLEMLPPRSEERFFVELRLLPRGKEVTPDIGFLFLTDSALLFEGERQRILIPRDALSVTALLRRSIGDLAGAYVFLPLIDSPSVFQFIGRDNATRLSETVQDSIHLEAALRRWLHASPASSANGGASSS